LAGRWQRRRATLGDDAARGCEVRACRRKPPDPQGGTMDMKGVLFGGFRPAKCTRPRSRSAGRHGLRGVEAAPQGYTADDWKAAAGRAGRRSIAEAAAAMRRGVASSAPRGHGHRGNATGCRSTMVSIRGSRRDARGAGPTCTKADERFQGHQRHARARGLTTFLCGRDRQRVEC
jgi:hypothetical protein